MLQPLQLEEVSARHAEVIAELRDFLAKAGLPVGTAGVLHVIVETLHRDRGFHRDLTSHIWVLMDRGVGKTGTLLGILAVAAAGPQFATQANAEDAHELLRFVMAARHSMESPSSGQGNEPAEQPLPVKKPAIPADSHENPQFQMQAGTANEESTERMAKRIVWAIGIAALLVVAISSAWLWLRPTTRARVAVAPIESAPTQQSSPSLSLPGDNAGESYAPAAPSKSASPAKATHHADSVAAQPFTPTYAANEPQAGRASVVARSSITPVPPTQRATAPQALAAPVERPNGRTLPVPSSTLSKRLGSPSMPAYAPEENEAVTRKHPRLLRRVPDTADLRENNDMLLAEASPADSVPVPSTVRGTASVNARPAGTVRSAALGTMAANVMYTPVPPYPAEASAAGVQGEVRVQARIDPNGNVASARVISGPPLLRDAALNAVQHWRYKPWVASGRPTATSTVAVVDFELP